MNIVVIVATYAMGIVIGWMTGSDGKKWERRENEHLRRRLNEHREELLRIARDNERAEG